MNIDDLKYKACDICGKPVSVGRDVCDECCWDHGTHVSYLRVGNNKDILEVLKHIRLEAERSYKRDSHTGHTP